MTERERSTSSTRKTTSWWEKWRSSKEAVVAVVCMAIFTDLVAYGVVLPILPKLLAHLDLAYDQAAKIEKTAQLLYSYSIALFIATPVFGVVSDYYGNRTMPMTFGLLGLGLSSVLFAVGNSWSVLVLARAFQGIAAAASWVVGLALLADIFPADRLGLAMGQVMMFHTLGLLVGPLAGGIMSEYISVKSPFWLCAGLSFLDFIGRAWIRPPPPPSMRDQSKKEMVALVEMNSETIQEMRQQPQQNEQNSMKRFLSMMHRAFVPPPNTPPQHILHLLLTLDCLVFGLAIVLGSCCFLALETVVPTILETEYGMSESQASYVLMALILPNSFMSSAVGYVSDRVPRYKVMTVGLVLHGLSSLLLAFARSLPVFCVALVVIGSTVSILMTPAMPEMAALVTRLGCKASYAQVYAIFNACYSLGMILGPLLVATLQRLLGPVWSGVACGAVLVIYAPFFYFANQWLLARIEKRQKKQSLGMPVSNEIIQKSAPVQA